MRTFSLTSVVLAFTCTAFAADFAPALEWVQTIGSSGNNLVTSAAADSQGNLYIAGSTTSVDFPTTSAAQAVPGGSILVRIGLAGASATPLFPVNVPSIGNAAAAPSDPGTLYAVSGNRIFQTVDAGSTWSMVSQFASTVTLFGLAVDPSSSSTVYLGTFPLGLHKSIDGGATWTPINTGIPTERNGSINVAGIWVDPSEPNVVFAVGGFGLARSADGGGTWTVAASGIAFNSSLAFGPSPDGTVYLLSFSTISRSTDHGQTFTPLAPLPDRASPNTLAPDPHRAGVIYAGSTGGIYLSTDEGLTWNLKMPGQTRVLVADPNSSAFYATSPVYGIVKSSDGFATASPIGPNQPSITRLIVSGPNLFEISLPARDVFAVKLDNNGKVVYATYFGGSGDDTAAALAVGSDGSLYVAGSTNSTDLPVTSGAYLSQLPSTLGQASSFLFKLNPDGSTAWATYFAKATVQSIAVDSAGNPFIGGYTSGGLPTTPGAYQTVFQQTQTCTGFIGCFAGPSSAFVTKLDARGSGLIYSTYVATDNTNNPVQAARALVVDAVGNAWIGVGIPNGLSAGYVSASVVELNPAGSAVLASAVQPGLSNVAALALDADSNVYVAGAYASQLRFPATPSAFQPAPQPAIPALPYAPVAGGGLDAFVAKWDSSLTHLLAATLLGGELPDVAASVAIDASGAVIVSGYTDSKAFPTHAPIQVSFASRSGFVAGFDSNLTRLLFSTYLGDRPFAAYAAVPDGGGNVLVAGSTLGSGGPFVGGDNGASFTTGNLVVANKIALAPAPAVRLDSVENYASHIAQALAPGEPILALGAGFGDGAQIVLDGSPLVTVSATATSIVAVLPDNASTSGNHTLQVSSNGALSNAVYAPAAPASPAIYSVDGSGFGQGYILNSDGTMNSPSNPAAPGAAITIFAAGAGQYTLSNGYAVTAEIPAVYVYGLYCNGIAATIGPVDGLPGNVYRLSVYIPDPADLVKNNPDLKNYKYPPQSPVRLVMGSPNSLNFANSPMVSQDGLVISIAQ